MKHSMESSILTPTFLYEEARRRYQEIKKCTDKMESEILKAPSGIIHIVNSGKRVQFYLRDDKYDKSGKYIRKSDAKTIRTFLQKSYDEKVMKLLNVESKSLEIFLKKSDNITKKIQQLYSVFPLEIKQYVDPIDMSDDDYTASWLRIPYQGKTIPEYIPVYQTNHGEMVRSKSELTIANKLADKGIPYKYECPLTLSNGTTIYPDFTILDVRTRKEIYWEHRGLMDDREYARQAVFKMKSMMKDGMILGKNLIITEETTANPLGTNEIDAVIMNYFTTNEH
ncbi:MAG: hypothetical protein J6Q02_08085 [Lachnospiraceae bacterium]|nr:hypothetical protein [Lachnospiraceae bacterium]